MSTVNVIDDPCIGKDKAKNFSILPTQSTLVHLNGVCVNCEEAPHHGMGYPVIGFMPTPLVLVCNKKECQIAGKRTAAYLNSSGGKIYAKICGNLNHGDRVKITLEKELWDQPDTPKIVDAVIITVPIWFNEEVRFGVSFSLNGARMQKGVSLSDIAENNPQLVIYKTKWTIPNEDIFDVPEVVQFRNKVDEYIKKFCK